MSARTIVYKGMLLAGQVGSYYKDLQDTRVVSALALVHQRFSTNTFPTWDLAHPFRMIAHNGEINTLRGNVNWIRARQGAISSPVLGKDLDKIWPLIYDGQSDSASFDNALELLVMSGYSIGHAMMMLIPEAWEGHTMMDPSRRAFYEYHAAMMEPWDGPAAVAFSDGRQIGATLDRNGLRPARYLVTDDDLVIMGSECGCLPVPEEKIVKKWRLQPGKMFLVDLEAGRIIDDKELKDALASAKPYREWIERIRIKLDDLPEPEEKRAAPDRACARPAAGLRLHPGGHQVHPHAHGRERRRADRLDGQRLAARGAVAQEQDAVPLLQAAVRAGHQPADRPDPRGAGDVAGVVHRAEAQPARHRRDEPAAAAGGEPAGARLRADRDDPPHRQVHPRQVPLLRARHHLSAGLGQRRRSRRGWRACARRPRTRCAPATASSSSPTARWTATTWPSRRCWRCPRCISIWSTRACAPAPAWWSRPAPRARCTTSRCSGGYGAEAVHPYLALDTIAELAEQGLLPNTDAKKACKNFVKAIGKGLRKVMSKMGISTYMSYTGAQIFEAVGLSRALVDKYFTGTTSTVEGIGVFEIAEEAIRIHRTAFGHDPVLEAALDAGGEYAFRVRGEEHMWTPDAIAKLQHSTRNNSFDTYKEYAQIINDQSKRHMTFRGLFEFRFDQCAAGSDRRGGARQRDRQALRHRRDVAGIDLHRSAHHARHRHEPHRRQVQHRRGRRGPAPLCADPGRRDAGLAHRPRPHRARHRARRRATRSSPRSSRWPRAASAPPPSTWLPRSRSRSRSRRAPSPARAVSCPARRSPSTSPSCAIATPGVELISPPPHHDIYSIEDLAQLIHDLKNANHRASISVKLVSEVGVGTVAAGVSKAKADHVTIAGHDGGTGASPWSSIKHAGTPWELGLAETQQTLVLNRLRGRIAVQVDGQIKTGRDVVVGAMLGADEFGFATAPLVVSGCIMMRKCHLNTCPVGVATQDPVLRRKFRGQPEHVINFFFFVAEEVRQLMAQLGVRKFNDLIGAAHLLDMKRGIEHWKAKGLDFSRIFYMPKMPPEVAVYHCEKQDHGLEKALDLRLIELAQPALERGERVTIEMPIRNINRTVGTMLSGEIASRYGHDGLARATPSTCGWRARPVRASAPSWPRASAWI